MGDVLFFFLKDICSIFGENKSTLSVGCIVADK